MTSSISVDLNDHYTKPKSSTWYTSKNKNKSSFFFIETDKTSAGVANSTVNAPEFILGYTRNIFNWVRSFRADNSGYLLILRFPDSDTAGRDFWRALQDLPELRDAKTGISDQETHKHTFPRYRIRGRILAGLIAKQVVTIAKQGVDLTTGTTQSAPEIVTDLSEFMVG